MNLEQCSCCFTRHKIVEIQSHLSPSPAFNVTLLSHCPASAHNIHLIRLIISDTCQVCPVASHSQINREY